MSQKTETKMVPQRVTVSTTCDACGKTADGYNPDGWHHFDSHHSEWGNDSVDSYEYHDACSFACYLVVVRREFANYPDHPHPSLKIDDKDWAFVRDMLAHTAAPV